MFGGDVLKMKKGLVGGLRERGKKGRIYFESFEMNDDDLGEGSRVERISD